MELSGRLFPGDGVGWPLNQAELLGTPILEAKSSISSFEQKAERAGGYVDRSCVERGGHRDGVALAVDYGIVVVWSDSCDIAGCLERAAEIRGGDEGCAGRGQVGIDAGAPRFGVFF